ncbi:TIGR01212 family radical SAM protein [Helicobacter fennelliae]|uniref:Predicted Fe-S oxidoreductase n=2 Tax=Helicobacter fennelliae TaxID=215 RepID=T1CR56_9HELI|nr:TIGR01212 family radical SAM protein [Helicobacter fennelliae]GAD19239.1 predicted Fe-S oxidoreductase [Helicobacter fennelliae MRY12-0050]SQB99022.1 radical SAM domain-containing protein [Helicobacter fennelliae]STP08303.1 radical SAM domain-containing protein [Helicobacter fennelliae]STQ84716.1 radical SAM domain-containing protein [Helicobacter fennelliae]
MRQLLTIGRYFQSKFGQRVRKIPISLQGFTCPNIDGSLAKGGCIYCRNESFSPSFIKIEQYKPSITMNFSLKSNPILSNQLSQLEEQFYWHANFHKDKFEVKKYMMYFQSYTNTYAPLSTLKALYDKALGFENVVGMSIGTRIDCVSDEILDLLEGYVKDGKEIWLEYGIQSVFDKTLALINRAHSIQGAQELFAKTRQRGIKVCAHLMYGLPNETADMMLHSLDCVLRWGIDGIKIHPLYVVEQTQLARMYEAKKYEPIDLDSYVELIVESIQRIPPDVVIQRISSGAHHQSLIAPKWCFDKNIQMRILRERLLEIGVVY